MDTKTWDSIVPPQHSPPSDIEDDALSNSMPYSPSDLPIPRPSWEDVCNQYDIPLSLSCLEHLDRTGLAYLYSSRGILQEEAQLAEQRYHQQIIVLRAFELRFAKAEAKLSAASQKLDLIAKVAQVVVSADAQNTGHKANGSELTPSAARAPGKLSMPLSQAFIDSARRFMV
jgi:hypothetical protein